MLKLPKKTLIENTRVLIGIAIFTEIIFSLLNLAKINLKNITNAINHYHLIVFRYIFIIALIFLAGVLISYFLRLIKRISRTNRWDVFITGLFAALAVIYLHNRNRWTFVNPSFIFLIVLLYLVTLAIFTHQGEKKIVNKESFFLSDNPEEEETRDYLDMREDAENFAKIVVDNFSNESLVFGLDAPWGSGKTTFINFCKKYWERKHKDTILVFDFEPLNFIGSQDIFDKFITLFFKKSEDILNHTQFLLHT